MQVIWYREVPGKAVYHLVRESIDWTIWCGSTLPANARVTLRPSPGRRLCQNCFAGFAVHSPMLPGIWATAPEAEDC